ncbi:glycosyltransferase [Sulfurovum sp. zt1-1]|uniref:Glycosyltransferase n=1 Tax=Sulfurovum zhangzhouensis TaxID=3019067 RepID=A0ABT7R0H3_9BACT|nr:glycosyltransferase [Sulfurovum zhangzhouensis]MDM5272543.1 glycosyltransferase [Sulfurovum zhangzhouensis]
MQKPKLLCILHLSPPSHGAAKVGDFIFESEALKENFECRFIPIRSSESIGDIGKINPKKFWLVAVLFFRIFWALIVFRPEKIYFTASIRSVAFYRDLIISLLWKMYRLFRRCEVYYHYHTKGIDTFVSVSPRNLQLTRFFLKGVNLILLSPLLEKDVRKVQTYQSVYFLPNGIEDPLGNEDFSVYISEKYAQVEPMEVLYLAHMMKDKGYDEVLELARQTKGENIHYHFAGSWRSSDDEVDFEAFVHEHGLEESVTYHGFVSGGQKAALFKKAHLLVYPSKNDAFPLTLLEALAYGVPVIATPEGSIPYILDEKCGILLQESTELYKTLQLAKTKLMNEESARYCRKRFEDQFTLKQFESNLVQILKKEENA